ncbi:MAG: hypothetical protein H6Q72_3290 [Firmicutes bacterium]|nr:hypothetical protein [Bacillota bacterium]
MSRRHHRKSTQLALNDTLLLPCDKPDIECILRATVTPSFEKVMAADRRLIFSGDILIHVEYVACVPDGSQPIHFVSLKKPFDGMISHRYACKGMHAQLKGVVEIFEFQVINPRSIRLSLNLLVYSVRFAHESRPLPPHIGVPCNNLYGNDQLRGLLTADAALQE